MGSMSTPINQLPTISNEIIQQNKHQLEDSTITDVINEMEREIQQPSIQMQEQQQYQMQQQQLHQMQQQQLHQMQQQQILQQQYPQQFQQHALPHQDKLHSTFQLSAWIHTQHAQRAILAAAVAFVLFYPFETGAIYEKIPYFINLHDYDRLIRTFLLAVTLYVLLVYVKI
jgi:hypothetical protein